ncbi:DinB family protein [Leucobacter sp. M11]|uniref:DinB family protein n=1 Tax=Leucobacter sp. M11 TaxID=2993565 RepID=UPI002D7E49B6|nr:DinB family protein [Leucobacter sp. M11]MEB4614762.1 DinB family protein [Leucobacter sp. M11]
MTPPKEILRHTLNEQRAALRWKLEGLSERELRWPMTPTGTNLLGLVKHVATIELGYFGEVFGRPSGIPTPWIGGSAEPNADLWATPAESKEQILRLSADAEAHSNLTIDELELEAIGIVPWWTAERGRVTLHQILVHMIAETARHAGQADILRELIDGSAGMQAGNSNLPELSPEQLAEQRRRLEAIAEGFRD